MLFIRQEANNSFKDKSL